MNKMRIISLIVMMTAVLLITACSDGGNNNSSSSNENSDTQEDKGTIKIGMNNWAENVAVSNMWKILLEDKGYEVELVQVEKAIMYTGLAENDLDIGMEIWLPTTDKPYYEKYKEDIDLRETWYEGTELALTVPSYMEDINSIEDLEANKDQFDSNIVGIDPGSSIMGLTEDVIKEYNLDFSLNSASEPAMLTELEKKIDKKQPIVVTLWKPHSAYANMDLKNLEDPKNVYGDSEEIYYGARKELADDHPEVVEWFDAFFLDDDQLGSLMAELEKADSEEAGAQAWIDDNKALIDKWFDTAQ